MPPTVIQEFVKEHHDPTYVNQHWLDESDNPAGGVSSGRGFCISWQNGPLGHGADRIDPNGAFVEGIIMAAADRLRYYQNSKFACDYNAQALLRLEEALQHLALRTNDRDQRGVEGTHEE